VWDKGKAALVDIAVECEAFTVRYGIFLPGCGGWGGERGPSATSQEWHPSWHSRHATDRSRAALYRLTGDLHPIHIDSEVARANGFDRPILHGLCCREMRSTCPPMAVTRGYSSRRRSGRPRPSRAGARSSADKCRMGGGRTSVRRHHSCA